jgi:hypothetical protein
MSECNCTEDVDGVRGGSIIPPVDTLPGAENPIKLVE